VKTARTDASYTEVEESEADLERFEKWLTAMTAHDCFQAPACSIRGALSVTTRVSPSTGRATDS
jgi:hypothetical protein